MGRFLFLGIILYAVAVVGMFALDGGILAIVLPFLFIIGASLVFGPEEGQLKLDRRLSSDRASSDAPLEVTLSVTNEGGNLELLHIIDSPPPRLGVIDGETELLTSLAPGETVELKYVLAGRRGRYDFGQVRLRTSDLLGIFRRDVLVRAPGRFEFFILPKVSRLDSIPIRPRQTKVYAGTIPARVGGSGTEFFGVRSYQQGDSLRHINWRANARHPGVFYTNEYEQERVADVGIILDSRQRSNVRQEDEALFDFAIQATASVASAFLNDGNRVALLRYGEFLDWTVPGYGKIQRERILQALARAETGDSQVFDQLENLPTRFFPPKSQIVLISPLLLEDAESLIRLRARGYSLLVISPDPIAFEMELLGQSKAVDLAVRIARLERAILFQRLRQVGIQVMDWRVDMPFDVAFRNTIIGLGPLGDRHYGIMS